MNERFKIQSPAYHYKALELGRSEGKTLFWSTYIPNNLNVFFMPCQRYPGFRHYSMTPTSHGNPSIFMPHLTGLSLRSFNPELKTYSDFVSTMWMEESPFQIVIEPEVRKWSRPSPLYSVAAIVKSNVKEISLPYLWCCYTRLRTPIYL